MPISILMPALSPTMTEGNLIKWHKNKGDPVKAGDILAEIETDKATMEVEAVDEGVLGAILVAGGTENVKVNTPIALLLEEGEGEADLAKSLSALKSPPPEKSTTSAPSSPAEPSHQETTQIPSTVSPVVPETSGERLFASPLARRMASQNAVNLRDIQGSGPRGRIVKHDVLEALNRPIGGPLNIGAGESAFSGYEPPFQERSLSLMRKVIARRLTEAKQTVPHFYLSLNAKIDNLLEARRNLNQGADLKISVNDMVIQAVAKALARFPDVNVAWAGESLRVFERVDISVAVSIDTGLITPVLRDAHSKGLAQISAEMKDLVARARAGKLRPEEFQGGTFSLSNLGMFGIEQFSAIANPPQAGILAVGAGIPKAIVEAGEVRIATVMNLTLSLDHRAVDGALGAKFLREIKECLENPARMLL